MDKNMTYRQARIAKIIKAAYCEFLKRKATVKIRGNIIIWEVNSLIHSCDLDSVWPETKEFYKKYTMDKEI